MKKILILNILLISNFDAIWGYDYFETMNEQPSPTNRVVRSAADKSKTVTFKNDKSRVEKTGREVGRIDCKKMSKKMNKMAMEVICKPRKMLVKLEPDEGYIYHPDMILIERCAGKCGVGQSCMPIKEIETSILVKRMQIGYNTSSICWELNVKNHTRCKCDCELMDTDCNSRQKYNEDDCSCECTNMHEQADCQLRKGMKWDPDTCRCTCTKEEETCSDGLMWIPSICRCHKVDMDNTL